MGWVVPVLVLVQRQEEPENRDPEPGPGQAVDPNVVKETETLVKDKAR